MNEMRLRLVALVALLAMPGCDLFPSHDDDRTEITLLAAYTTRADEAADDVESVIRRAVAETNVVYANGDIPLALKLVGMAQVDYTLTERIQDLQRLVRTDDGYLDDLHSMRDQLGADLVVLVAEERSATINAAVMAEPSTAFAVVHVGTMGAPDYALAHELGHLQGARHTPDSDPALEPFAFGHAFRNDSIKTIMSTGGQQVLPYFSGPDQVYGGVVLGDSTRRNAAEVLRITAAYVSNFRGPITPTEFVPPGTWPTAEY